MTKIDYNCRVDFFLQKIKDIFFSLCVQVISVRRWQLKQTTRDFLSFFKYFVGTCKRKKYCKKHIVVGIFLKMQLQQSVQVDDIKVLW